MRSYLLCHLLVNLEKKNLKEDPPLMGKLKSISFVLPLHYNDFFFRENVAIAVTEL